MALVYNEQTGDFDDVLVPPIIRSVSIRELSPYYKGDTVTIIWNIDDANHVYINGEEQYETVVSFTLNNVGQQFFSLKATNADGTSERVISVDVLPCPYFRVNASSNILREGFNERVLFQWNIKDARKLKLRHNDTVEELPLAGELSFSPTSDTQYDFEAEGLEGHRLFHHFVPIKVRKAAQIKFSASRLFSYPNLPITLKWDVENASSVSIDNYGAISNSGTIEVSPAIDTTYTLRIRDAFGEEQRTLTVKMLPQPVIKNLFVPAPKIEENLSISYKTPQFNVVVPVPSFESFLTKLELPHIPTLKSSTFFINNLRAPKKSKYKNPFKTLYSYFFRK